MPHKLMINDMQWHCESEGEGPVLLFLHGWGVNSKVWKQQTKYFVNSYRVVSVDLPGHGGSSWQPMTLREMAENICLLLDQLDVNNFIIVGSSIGGLVGLKIVELYPQRVQSIIFVGSHPKFVQSDDYPFGLHQAQVDKISQQLKTSYPAMVHIFFRSLFTSQERQTRRFKWIHTFRKMDIIPTQQALLELLHVLEEEDLRGVLERVRGPIQFINGTEDYICQKETFHYWQKKLPHARFDWFEHCGHFPFLSKPREFNKVLGDFLSGLK